MDIPEDLTHSAYFKMLGCELRRLDEALPRLRCRWRRTCAIAAT